MSPWKSGQPIEATHHTQVDKEFSIIHTQHLQTCEEKVNIAVAKLAIHRRTTNGLGTWNKAQLYLVIRFKVIIILGLSDMKIVKD